MTSSAVDGSSPTGYWDNVFAKALPSSRFFGRLLNVAVGMLLKVLPGSRVIAPGERLESEHKVICGRIAKALAFTRFQIIYRALT